MARNERTLNILKMFIPGVSSKSNMGKNSFAYIILLLGLTNCSNNTSLKKSVKVFKTDTLVSSEDLNLLAVFKTEDEYQFLAESNGKILKTQMMNIFPSGLPQFEKFENHWVYLRGGCGSSCFYAYLIPINVAAQDSIKTYMFPLLVDQAKNIIIYCSEDTLMVENYTNGKSLSFKDKRLVGPYCGFAIENISIKENNVVFKINFSNTLTEEKIDIKPLL
jgi:hypothetical protein